MWRAGGFWKNINIEREKKPKKNATKIEKNHKSNTHKQKKTKDPAKKTESTTPNNERK